MRAVRRLAALVTVTAILLAIGLTILAVLRARSQDLPWTALDLGDPPGLFTGRKLAGLTHDFPKCRALLDKAGVRYEVLAPVHAAERCGYDDVVRFAPGGSRRDRLVARRSRCVMPGRGGAFGLGMECRPARGAAIAGQPGRRESNISAAIIAAISRAKGRGASTPPPMRSISPVSAWPTASGSPSRGTGRGAGRRRLSSVRYATVPAGCSRRHYRRTITPRITITCISTRRRGGNGAGGRAGERR